jgi:hypothetical protein
MKPITYKKPRKNLEHSIQVQIINWLRWNKIYCFAIGNGGKRNAVTGAILKKEGVLAGVADIQVLLSSGKSIFLEVKTPKGRQSPSQKEFQKEVEALGFRYYIVRSLEDVIKLSGRERTKRND